MSQARRWPLEPRLPLLRWGLRESCDLASHIDVLTRGAFASRRPRLRVARYAALAALVALVGALSFLPISHARANPPARFEKEADGAALEVPGDTASPARATGGPGGFDAGTAAGVTTLTDLEIGVGVGLGPHGSRWRLGSKSTPWSGYWLARGPSPSGNDERRAPPGDPLPAGVEMSTATSEASAMIADSPLGGTRVEIAGILIQGVDTLGTRQVRKVLEAEDLRVGSVVVVPNDLRVSRARSRLVREGWYSRVTIRVLPRTESAPGVLGSADLIVDLEERSSIAIPTLILGSSRLVPFRGGIELLERNFLGRGIQIGGGIAWGSLPRIGADARRQQAYRLGIEAPRLGGTRLGIGAAAWFISANEPYRVAGRAEDPNPKNYRAFDYERVGGRMGLRVHATPNLRLSADYRIEAILSRLPIDPVLLSADGSTTPIDLEIERGRHLHNTIDLGLRWDGREQLLSIGNGGRVAVDVSLGSPFLGSRYEFAKISFHGGYSFRLPWRHVLTPSLGGAQVVGRAPRFERFAAGDASDWTPGRESGLLWSTRNPIDVFGTGVDQLQIVSIYARADLEYAIPLFRFPQTRFFEGGFFVLSAGTYILGGNAAERQRRSDQGESLFPVGLNGNLGLRLETNIGPIDITIGNILSRTPL